MQIYLQGIILGGVLFGVGCASLPIESRLEKNFVYNCTLKLLEKKVSPQDAEKICTSSHAAEMAESDKTAPRTPAAIPVEANPPEQKIPAKSP